MNPPLKYIREKLNGINEFEEIHVKQIDKKTVNFGFFWRSGAYIFSTGTRNARVLLREIEVTKSHIKLIEIGFEY